MLDSSLSFCDEILSLLCCACGCDEKIAMEQRMRHIDQVVTLIHQERSLLLAQRRQTGPQLDRLCRTLSSLLYWSRTQTLYQWNLLQLRTAAGASLFHEDDLPSAEIIRRGRKVRHGAVTFFKIGGRQVACKTRLGLEGMASLAAEFFIGCRLRGCALFVGHYNQTVEETRSGIGSHLWMERVRGETLKQRIEQDRLPDGERLAQQLVAGMKEALARGLLPCDLKASNLLLTREGNLKICDFEYYQELTLDTTMQLWELPAWIKGHSKHYNLEELTDHLRGIVIEYRKYLNKGPPDIKQRIAQCNLALDRCLGAWATSSQSLQVDLAQRPLSPPPP